MNRFLASIGTAVVLVAGTAAAAGPAIAAPTTSYALAFTDGQGAYPRSTPTFENRTGTAMAEGSAIDAACWVYGGDVTNPFGYTSSVWIQDAAGSFWPEAWLETGSSGVPQGLASCDQSPTEPASEPVVAPAPQPESSWQPNCTPGGPWIEGTTEPKPIDGGVRIILTPTMLARYAHTAGLYRESTVDMWHAIQACVPDLYGATADSVWQQLECHQRGALLQWPDGRWGTGPTYDLETTTDPLMLPNDLTYALSRCLNAEGDPATTLTFFAATE